MELQIEEVLKYEKSMNSDKIMNISLIEDEVAVIKCSICKQKGALHSTDRKSLAKFFGYGSDVEFREIHHINQLMPSFIAEVHDSILDNYLQRGKSTIFTQGQQVFIQNKQQYI